MGGFIYVVRARVVACAGSLIKLLVIQFTHPYAGPILVITQCFQKCSPFYTTFTINIPRQSGKIQMSQNSQKISPCLRISTTEINSIQNLMRTEPLNINLERLNCVTRISLYFFWYQIAGLFIQPGSGREFSSEQLKEWTQNVLYIYFSTYTYTYTYSNSYSSYFQLHLTYRSF